MELEFSADQEALRDAIRAVLTKEAPISLARAVVEHRGRADQLWSTMVELGWPGLTIAESWGGTGLGMVELGILTEELGRVIAPGPLLTTASQFVPVVQELGTEEQRAHWLGAVASDGCRGTIAIAERGGSFDPTHVTAIVRADGNDIVLSGEKRFVLEADDADEIIVVGREPNSAGADGLAAVVVPASAVRSTALHAVDGSRSLVDVALENVRLPASRRLAGATDVARGLQRALETSTVALALEMVGTAQTIFDLTLEYAKHRKQFGVPIGSFQAIKHKFADMMIALERARATGYFAALTIAEDDARRASATSVAKAAAGDCQRLLAKEGIQIHGGIGYTWEHDMHLLVKRLKSSEPLLGSSATHRARIADLLGV
ncbi:MAG TPA: acyl-CoA dehydrogenase family protein [Acidimicrobiia bacterium]|nr:acyl-CoA dehydrogenase family protein [Acidimicrobiia bacterium]